MPSPYLNGLFDKIIVGCKYDLEATIETTRGCPFGCTFCEIGTKYYQKIKTNMRYTLLFYLFLSLVCCEPDDICSQSTQTTPRLVIDFYDIENL